MQGPFRLTFVLTPSRRKAARITLALGGGVFMGGQERELSRKYLNIMLRALTEMNVEYLRTYPNTPRLANAGMLYREEPPGQEDWQDIPTSLKMGIFDCEDASAWRAAELIVFDGIPAAAVWKEFTNPDGSTLFHIVVERSDGITEDPSAWYGMR